MTDKEIALLLRWLLKHYSTFTIDGMFGYVDSIGRETSTEDIVNHYKIYSQELLDGFDEFIKQSPQLPQQEISDEELILPNVIISSPQYIPELSDEEIEKAFTIETEVQTTKYVGEIAGAKWYREQLKSKGNGES